MKIHMRANESEASVCAVALHAFFDEIFIKAALLANEYFHPRPCLLFLKFASYSAHVAVFANCVKPRRADNSHCPRT